MCCSSFLKCMMFIFNGCIFVAGAAILAVGIWFKVDSESLLGIVDSIENAPSQLSLLAGVSYLLIGLGAFLVIIGFLGCCGAVKESRCMLLTFFCIVLIIFLAEVTGAVLILVFNGVVDDVLKEVENEVVNSIETNYGEDPNFTQLWNATMEKLTCCGYTNYTNFIGSPFTETSGIFPMTCCEPSNALCSKNLAQTSAVIGCFDQVLQLINDNMPIVAGVALGIAALEIAAMTVSMILYKQIGVDSRRK